MDSGANTGKAKMRNDAPDSRAYQQENFAAKAAEVADESFSLDAVQLRKNFEKSLKRDPDGRGETGRASKGLGQQLLQMFKVANGGSKSNRNLRCDVLAFLEDGTPFTAPK